MDHDDYKITLSNIPPELRQKLLHAVRNTDYINTEFIIERHEKKDSWCLRWLDGQRFRTVNLGKDDQVAKDVRMMVDKLSLEALFLELKVHAQAVHDEHREKVMFKDPFLLFGKPDDIPRKRWTDMLDILLETDIVNTRFSVVSDGQNAGKSLMWEVKSRLQFYNLGRNEKSIEAVKELVEMKNRDKLRRILHIYKHREELLREYDLQVKDILQKLYQEASQVRDKILGDTTWDTMLASEVLLRIRRD